MGKLLDENRVGQSFRYEVGKKRFDGKLNIWHLVELSPQQWTWVIVFVAPNWRIAKDWITRTEAKETLA